MKRECGFTVIELLIVVFIAGIIAAIVIPNVMVALKAEHALFHKNDVVIIKQDHKKGVVISMKPTSETIKYEVRVDGSYDIVTFNEEELESVSDSTSGKGIVNK